MDQRLTAEEELALAQQRVAEARRKIDLLEEARLQKLRQEIAKAAAEDERRRFEQAEEQKLVEQKWLEKRRAEQQGLERERRAKEAVQRELERSLAKAEDEQLKRKEHEQEVERLANEAFLLEQEARRREAELVTHTSAIHAASDPADATTGRELLFCRLAKPASRFDGHDGHAAETSSAEHKQ
jgi:translation initiation factor IF-2